MARYPKFVPRHQFLKERQRLRMANLRYQRQLNFQSRFPVRFERKGRLPTVPAPRNYYFELQSLYGRFPVFKKLPVVSARGRFVGWRFYRDRFEWAQDFVYLVRTLRRLGIL